MTWLRHVVGVPRAALADLQRAPAAPNTPRAVLAAALGLGLLFALVYQVGIPLRATYAARVNVDEPFYLLTTVSLLEDGDLDLTNDYELRRYRQFFDHPDELWYQSAPTADGRVLSPHNVGLSALVLPAYALGGVDGAKLFLAVLGGATVAMAGLLAYRATGHGRASLLAAAVLGSTAPLFVYATQVYPEIPAALLVATCAWLLLEPRPGPRVALGLALGVTGLVWLGSKYAVVGGTIGLVALARLQPRGRVVLLGVAALSALVYAWFHLATYGDLTPYAVNRLYAGSTTTELLTMHVEIWNRLYRFLGLWVDGEFGLVRWAPVLLLVLPGMALLAARRGPERWTWFLLVACQVLVAVFLSITMRGWWFPGRMLVVVLPLLAAPLAVTLAAAGRWWFLAALATGLGVYTAAVTGALVIASQAGLIALAVDPFSLAWPPFQALRGLFPVYTAYTPTTWALTAGWAVAFAGLTSAPWIIRATRRGLVPRVERRAAPATPLQMEP